MKQRQAIIPGECASRAVHSEVLSHQKFQGASCQLLQADSPVLHFGTWATLRSVTLQTLCLRDSISGQ